MGVAPPYLFDAGPAEVAVRSNFDADITVVSVHGPWNLALATRVSATLHKCFSAHPRGLVLDLTGLDDRSGSSAPAWVNAYRRAADMDPPVPVAVSATAGSALTGNLRRMGTVRFLPLYDEAATARQALEDGLPMPERLELRLDRAPGTPARARKLIQEACGVWGLEDLEYPARLVVSELVSNVIEHTDAGGRLLVARRRTALHIAVADSSAVLPRLRSATPGQVVEGGRGLHIVQQASVAWGTMPTDGGKVVWAIVRDPLPG